MLDRLAMHQEWYDKNRTMLFIEASVVMQELLAMCRQYKAERDEARRRLCVELLEVEGHPIGWQGLRGAEGIAQRLGWGCFQEDNS